MRLSAKTDYALRTCAELGTRDPGAPLTAEEIAARQDIPLRFLKTILPGLAEAGILQSRRGRAGGWLLARDPSEISLADVIRVVDGPLASVAGIAPHDLYYRGGARQLREVWISVRWHLRNVLETITIADLSSGGELPAVVLDAAADPDAWAARA